MALLYSGQAKAHRHFSKGFSDTTSVYLFYYHVIYSDFVMAASAGLKEGHTRVNDKNIYLAKSQCLGRLLLNWYTHTSEGWDDCGGEAKHLGRVFPVAQMRPQFIRATRAEQLKRDRVAECGLSGHISYAQEQGCLFVLVRQSSNRKRYATPMLKRRLGNTAFSCHLSPRATFKSIRWWMARRRSRTTGRSASAAPTRPWHRSCA